MAELLRKEQPKVEIEKKLGNTTYIVNGFYATEGVTVSEKIKRLIDRDVETKTE